MIDIHTHLHPPLLFAAIRRWFAQHSDWDVAGAPSEPHAVAAVLREAGVERFVFCSYAHKAGIARELNAWLAATSRALGAYGLPLATVHPADPEYLRDAREALDAGCIGLKLHEDVQRLDVDDERLAPVFEELSARGAFLLVHVGPIPWQYPAHVGAARVERVLRKHPRLNVVVAHFGTPDTLEYFTLMDRFERLYLDTTMVFGGPSLVRAPVDVAVLERYFDRVLYGTDFPNVPYPYANERAGIERLGLSATALQAIVRGNAARLLGEAGTGV
ncbi:MAG: amidohydrolase family protein [Candidatus Eremiobacteraeota bacterium]|nr:amidohydrolase family protein [Candidatus Eremiobacteraeota bacterium]